MRWPINSCNGRPLEAEREAVIGLRNRGEINDEVLRRIERELDLEEQQLAGEAGKT